MCTLLFFFFNRNNNRCPDFLTPSRVSKTSFMDGFLRLLYPVRIMADLESGGKGFPTLFRDRIEKEEEVNP